MPAKRLYYTRNPCFNLNVIFSQSELIRGVQGATTSALTYGRSASLWWRLPRAPSPTPAGARCSNSCNRWYKASRRASPMPTTPFQTTSSTLLILGKSNDHYCREITTILIIIKHPCSSTHCASKVVKLQLFWFDHTSQKSVCDWLFI